MVSRKELINPRSLFPITNEDIRRLLEAALSKGGEFSELYFEYNISSSVSMEEDIIKSSSESIYLGVGVRVLNGEQTGYAYTSDLTVEKILQAALTAAAIANSNSRIEKFEIVPRQGYKQIYDLQRPLTFEPLADKINLVRDAYSAAQNYDPKIVKISASLADSLTYVTIANSDGLLATDTRPQVRMIVAATAEENGKRDTGMSNTGGRTGINYYTGENSPVEIGKRAAKEALLLLSAEDAPAGEQVVVLGSEQSGVLIHEAVGHPLEADGNWKKTSIMSGRMGEIVANTNITIYDDATIPAYRGSLNMDDEGTETETVPLIENGKLVGFMNDKLGARILNHKPNGHGRRESYEFQPIPRMNNTILERGNFTPEEIIASVEKGFYATSFQGGMVNHTGKFTFTANLGYLIENGKITRPVKNATLIGSNIQILKSIDMVGNDMGFFLGTCGKDGQSVPVTCGTPTLRINKMTVGGRQ